MVEPTPLHPLRRWRVAQSPKLNMQRAGNLVPCTRQCWRDWELSHRIPERSMMRRIFVLTNGTVRPNDFYDLPSWEAELIEREGRAELDRRAA